MSLTTQTFMTRREFQREPRDYIHNLDAGGLRRHLRELLHPVVSNLEHSPELLGNIDFKEVNAARRLLTAVYALTEVPHSDRSRAQILADAQRSIMGALINLELVDKHGAKQLSEEIASGKYRSSSNKLAPGKD